MTLFFCQTNAALQTGCCLRVALGYSCIFAAALLGCRRLMALPQLKVAAGSYRRWWPAGFASHQLYSLTVTARATCADGGGHAQHSSLTRRIGFRTVRLVRDPLTAPPDAETFYFEINGVPTFMRGAQICSIS